MLRDDEEWAELRHVSRHLPFRAFDPSEIKRVAMVQLASRLLPRDVAVLKVEPVVSARLFERFQRALEAARGGEDEEAEEGARGTTVEGERRREKMGEQDGSERAEGEEAVEAEEAAVAEGACSEGDPPQGMAVTDLNERILAPTLAFHGAPSHEALAGILAEGLLAPGELISRTGHILEAHHGNRYGDGRYLSQDLHLAAEYALADATCKRQVLLCLVAPGRCERLPHGFEEDAATDRAAIRHADWHLARCRVCTAPRCDGVQCKLLAARAALNGWRTRQQMCTLHTAPAKLIVGAATSMDDVKRHAAEVAAKEARRAAGLS